MCIIVKCENHERDERSTAEPDEDVTTSLSGCCFYHIDIPEGDQEASAHDKSCLGFQEIESWLNTSGQVDLAHTHTNK